MYVILDLEAKHNLTVSATKYKLMCYAYLVLFSIWVIQFIFDLYSRFLEMSVHLMKLCVRQCVLLECSFPWSQSEAPCLSNHQQTTNTC